VKEVWMITDKIEIRKTNWHGWLLTYLTSKYFLSVNMKISKITISNKICENFGKDYEENESF